MILTRLLFAAALPALLLACSAKPDAGADAASIEAELARLKPLTFTWAMGATSRMRCVAAGSRAGLGRRCAGAD